MPGFCSGPGAGNPNRGGETKMSKMLKRILTAAVASSALLAIATGAQAGAFQLREQSAAGMGQGFAGVAAGVGGLSSMFWNPATITQYEGWQSSWSISGILPRATTTTDAARTFPAFNTFGDTGNIGIAALLPASYSSYQLNDSLWLGLAVGGPFGLKTKYDKRWSGGFYGQTSEVFSTDITPTIAYKVNEWLSVAAGVQIEYFKTRLTQLRPPAFATYTAIDGDSWGYGFTLGATLKPFAGTEIGIGYRSQVKQGLKGSINNGFGLPATLAIRSNLTLPDELTIGINQKITDKLSISAGFEWTHWSLFNSFPVRSAASGAVVTNLAFRYRDGWLASVGGAYQYNEALLLRAGLGYEKSPISDTVRTVRLTDNDRVWTSLGASYRVSNKLSVDVSYAHAFIKKSPITINSIANPAFNPLAPLAYVGSNKASLDIVSLGLNYRWDDPRVAIPMTPIVRKY